MPGGCSSRSLNVSLPNITSPHSLIFSLRTLRLCGEYTFPFSPFAIPKKLHYNAALF